MLFKVCLSKKKNHSGRRGAETGAFINQGGCESREMWRIHEGRVFTGRGDIAVSGGKIFVHVWGVVTIQPL